MEPPAGKSRLNTHKAVFLIFIMMGGDESQRRGALRITLKTREQKKIKLGRLGSESQAV